MEEYGQAEEQEVEGGGDMAGEDGGGWVATSRAPAPGAGAGTSVDGFEEISSPHGAGGSAAAEAGEGPADAGGAEARELDEGSDSDVPDIADLDLEEEEEEDEVRAVVAAQ